MSVDTHLRTDPAARPGAPTPPPSAAPAGRSWTILVTLLLVTTMLSTVAGALSAYYVVGHVPIPPQIAVLDTEVLLKQALTKNPNDPKAAANTIVASVKRRTQALAEMGVVVIDRSLVIDAPPSAFVRLDGLNNDSAGNPQ